ncbi:cytochrome P450 [Intrasporangium mesophilum]
MTESVLDERLLSTEILECPYPYYRRVRDEAPVHRTSLGFWLVTRFADVSAVLHDTSRFSSAVPMDVHPDVVAIYQEGYPEVATLLAADPPAHTYYRGLVNKAFLPRRVAQLEDEITRIALDLVEKFIDRGRVELVSELAIGLPVTVIADALGVDRADQALFKRWSDDIVAPRSGLLNLEERRRCAHSLVELQHYLAARAQERRDEPRDDLLSDLVQARFDSGEREGQPLTDNELIGILRQIMVAGNETTTSLIAGAMKLLVEHPKELAATEADHSRIPLVLDEALRVDAPIQMLPRRTVVDAEVGGTVIPAGEVLYLVYASANRDGARFEDPEQFCPARPNVRQHLAFGQGAHFCPGSALARSEARIALGLLLSKATDWRLDPAVSEPVQRQLSMTLRGLSALHLTFTPRR